MCLASCFICLGFLLFSFSNSSVNPDVLAVFVFILGHSLPYRHRGYSHWLIPKDPESKRDLTLISGCREIAFNDISFTHAKKAETEM